MTVPSSGTISLNSIYNELDDNTYPGSATNSNVSLTKLSTGGDPPDEPINQSSSSKPDGSTPHAMSEFHGYNHGTAFPGFTLYYFAGKASTCSSVCSSSSTVTVYSDTATSVTDIFTNDRKIYEDSAGTTLAPSRWYAEGTDTGDECGKWTNTGSGEWVSGFQGQCGQ